MKFKPQDLKLPKYVYVFFKPNYKALESYFHPHFRIFRLSSYSSRHYEYISDFNFQTHKEENKLRPLYGGSYNTYSEFKANLDFMNKFYKTAKKIDVFIDYDISVKAMIKIFRAMGVKKFCFAKIDDSPHRKELIPFKYRNNGIDYWQASKLIAA